MLGATTRHYKTGEPFFSLSYWEEFHSQTQFPSRRSRTSPPNARMRGDLLIKISNLTSLVNNLASHPFFSLWDGSYNIQTIDRLNYKRAINPRVERSAVGFRSTRRVMFCCSCEDSSFSEGYARLFLFWGKISAWEM